ncbi:MAG: hypothetical protein HQL15_10545 [Candidatus Omnitrophica bacterium]|nr:hypothetical protein [Candidatus Omnitrophota bacterium]
MANKIVLMGLYGATGTGKTMLSKVYLKKMGFQVFSIEEEIWDFAKSFRGISRESFDDKNKDVPIQKLGGLTPRMFLKDLNEVGRKYSEGKLCWIDSLWEKKIRNLPPETMVCIHDVNYKNEVDYIQSKSGYLVRIDRKGYDLKSREFDAVSPDKVLLGNNNTTPQDLEKFAYELSAWGKKLNGGKE